MSAGNSAAGLYAAARKPPLADAAARFPVSPSPVPQQLVKQARRANTGDLRRQRLSAYLATL